ncbi:MAG: LysR family transcriptional regulator [Verrucomicrobia bacterium]|jgi:LysR family transcriptional regulator, low CO2-responsive transcriptional regulator|nr:LysR family transcriptional regulator [Verrucomicrobiota bacterium]
MTNPIDSRQLRAFAALARTGSFTLAAKELFLSQSAVSHSMKALETDVGCRLFDRVGKKVLLTQAGESLLHHTEKILQEMAAARAGLEQLGKWGVGRLRIGASPTACQYILPAVLREFKESFPKCRIAIAPGDTLEAIESVRENRIDLAITLEPRNEDQFEFHPLFSDELAFIVGAMHPWAKDGHVVRNEIPKQSYVLYNKTSYTFRMVRDYFNQEDMVLNTVIELGSMEAIKELVKLGLGVGILSPWIAQKEIQEKSLVALPLGRRKMKRNWGVIHWRGRRLSLAEETFLGLCKAATADLGKTSLSDAAGS